MGGSEEQAGTPGPLGGPTHRASLPEALPTLSWTGSRGAPGAGWAAMGLLSDPCAICTVGPCSYTSQAQPTSLSPDMPSWGGHR